MGSNKGAFETAGSILPENWPAGTLALDKNGTITALNDLAAELFGDAQAVIVGKHLAHLLTGDSRHQIEEHLREAAAGGGPVKCEAEVIDGAGRPRHILVQTVANPSTDSSVAYRSTVFDLTSYIERIEKADHARASAERVARSKTDFLARLSHEIRSALASMVGFADLLKEKVPEADMELTEIIRESGRHLLDTLNSVMDLARLEFEKRDIERSEVDVVHSVRERVAILQKLAEARGLEFSFRVESESAVALLNRTFLDRVVHNLVDNAIKYTPQGKVEVSVEQRDGEVWIYVADTGIGIREDFLPRLFAPFERETRDDGTFIEGVGLGLAITKYLVELMDGRIVACSTKDSGSTFTVSFPAVEATSA